MKADHDRLKVLLVDTIALLCKSGLTFKREIRVQGLLGITVDDSEVFIVQLDEKSCVDGPSIESVPRDANLPFPTPSNRMPGSQLQGFLCQPRSQKCSPAKQQKSQFPACGPREIEGMVSTNQFSSPLHSETNNLNASSGQDIAVADLLPDILPAFDGDADLLAFKPDVRPVEQFDHDNKLNMAPFQNSFVQPLESGWSNGAGQANLPMTDAMRPKYKRKRRQKSEGAPGAQSDGNNMTWVDMGHSGLENPLLNMPGCSSWVSGGIESEMQSANDNLTELWNGGSANSSQYAKRSGSNGGARRRRTGESQEKVFACQYTDCGKSFYRKDHLTRHQRQKHGKPFGIDSQLVYYCQAVNCGKSFYKTSTLRRHMTEAHQMVDEFS